MAVSPALIGTWRSYDRYPAARTDTRWVPTARSVCRTARGWPSRVTRAVAGTFWRISLPVPASPAAVVSARARLSQDTPVTSPYTLSLNAAPPTTAPTGTVGNATPATLERL